MEAGTLRLGEKLDREKRAVRRSVALVVVAAVAATYEVRDGISGWLDAVVAVGGMYLVGTLYMALGLGGLLALRQTARAMIGLDPEYPERLSGEWLALLAQGAIVGSIALVWWAAT